jgi:hypothetical protein
MINIAKKSLEITGLFEAELIVWLMLRYWKHPFADNKDFANDLLESASSVLRSAAQGEQIIEGLPATALNLVAAIWYSEYCDVESGGADPDTIGARQEWLEAVRRTLPSCFCDPSDLPDM